MTHIGQQRPLPDLDLCALEPVQLIGLIQPHGLLFALSEPDLIVQQVSANVSTLCGMPPEAVTGHSIEMVLGSRQFEIFQARICPGTPVPANPLRVTVGGEAREMNCIAHRQDSALIVELELLQEAHSLGPLDLETHVQAPLARMDSASDILDLCGRAAREIRKLSGFDRVMIYRFDEEWNGEVIAETVDPLQGSYLGHRFPSSDIPPQVRQLFLINPLRAIADVGATPVAIIPEIGPLTGRPLDLTLSALRSASPIHLEYLRHMGVRSSLTISIIVKEKLWGMIACHHAEPLRVDCLTRSVCAVVGRGFASQVAFRVENGALQARLTSRKALAEYMVEKVASKSEIGAEHFRSPRLLELFDADSLISRVGGVVSYEGAAVEEELLLPVLEKLRQLSSGGIASSNCLSDLDLSATSFAIRASGALYFDLKPSTGDYLMLLRREFVETVVWAGNPNTAVSSDDQGRLSPRTSFAAWKQTVSGRSRPWSELEVESAYFLREKLLRLRETQELSLAYEALAAENKDRKKAEEELKKSQLDLTHAARHDFLTGLPNRWLLNERLSHAIALAQRHAKGVAVLFLDLDGFKHVNDSRGHLIGDRLLQSVAARLASCVRSSDTVSRLGGDEFAILLSEVEQPEDGAILARRILRAMSEAHSIDHIDLHVTTSIGVSVYPDDGLDGEALVKNADTAMYHAKENGRQGYRFFEPSMNVRAVARQSIEDGLRHALKAKEFTLHYQPKVNLITGEISGAEALMRWTHPALGLVSPAEFIPVAEQCGLILPIASWVLHEACNQARAWADAGLRPGTMAVNVSAIEFRQNNFLKDILAILDETGMDSKSLELELTESVLMRHPDSAAAVLRELRSNGVQIAIDDFGTGYSSLSYLRKFPIDALKIDQSFIRQITTAPSEATIVTAIINMGRSLNLQVVAEGVETLKELEFLQGQRCDEAQGYYFSRPVPAEQFAILLETGITTPARFESTNRVKVRR
jgi:diguanylate cyclase (GGDEF)-like protein